MIDLEQLRKYEDGDLSFTDTMKLFQELTDKNYVRFLNGGLRCAIRGFQRSKLVSVTEAKAEEDVQTLL